MVSALVIARLPRPCENVSVMVTLTGRNVCVDERAQSQVACAAGEHVDATAVNRGVAVGVDLSGAIEAAQTVVGVSL